MFRGQLYQQFAVNYPSSACGYDHAAIWLPRKTINRAINVIGVAETLRHELGARFEVVAVAPGALPVGEHKTRVVYRTAHGEELELS